MKIHGYNKINKDAWIAECRNWFQCGDDSAPRFTNFNGIYFKVPQLLQNVIWSEQLPHLYRIQSQQLSPLPNRVSWKKKRSEWLIAQPIDGFWANLKYVTAKAWRIVFTQAILVKNGSRRRQNKHTSPLSDYESSLLFLVMDQTNRCAG